MQWSHPEDAHSAVIEVQVYIDDQDSLRPGHGGLEAAQMRGRLALHCPFGSAEISACCKNGCLVRPFL